MTTADKLYEEEKIKGEKTKTVPEVIHDLTFHYFKQSRLGIERCKNTMGTYSQNIMAILESSTKIKSWFSACSLSGNQFKSGYFSLAQCSNYEDFLHTISIEAKIRHRQLMKETKTQAKRPALDKGRKQPSFYDSSKSPKPRNSSKKATVITVDLKDNMPINLASHNFYDPYFDFISQLLSRDSDDQHKARLWADTKTGSCEHGKEGSKGHLGEWAKIWMHKDDFWRSVPVEECEVSGQPKDLGMFGKECVYMNGKEWF
jgi:hypothetical protein